MLDPTKSVILPADDFLELQASAYSSPPKTTSDRIGGTVQTIIVCAALAGCVTASSWGIAKAMDWYEERQLDRAMRRKRPVNPVK